MLRNRYQYITELDKCPYCKRRIRVDEDLILDYDNLLAICKKCFNAVIIDEYKEKI